jgi:hypothetical protein
MSLAHWFSHARSHSMRAYYLPLAAGLALIASAFLPWVVIGEARIGGIPDMAGYWVLALGAVAVLLASLSIYTRRNSRHPLLLVGLAALGILFLGQRFLVRVTAQKAWAASQAVGIVDGVAPPPPLVPYVASGIYVGLAAAAVVVLFGLTIVFKRVATPYAQSDDDDV